MNILDELESLVEQARFATTFLDDPMDRMWHAADNTWWKRVGNKWEYAEPPEGWVKQATISPPCSLSTNSVGVKI